MKDQKLKIFIIIFVFVLFSCFIILVGNKYFIVKKIEVKKDFDINRERLLKYLDIKENKYFWEYDTRAMEEKLSKLYYISFYKVEKKFPGSLKIEIKMRKPLASISGTDGLVYFIDENGVVYLRNITNDMFPLIICSKTNFKPGLKINDNLMDTIDTLSILKEKEKNVYKNISQIEINERNDNNLEYIVIYRTINQRIYLKNSLNVDLLKEGFVCSLFLEEKGINDRNVFYSGAGFVY